ncbi:DUF4167 domain-containing protein [Rhodobacter ferrooxidans]|uniref:DUF4167 domain-containing protein n=1 Tax=Rhodobacter ferrooxidans TaxID=371731 RepID=C8S3W1_9RHOB|nr:DUF4167 domain-containing protein [Rhodobacter sp. SW2]EEW24330.1 conserved hypothetical protein [Rhodobacter sp. SW2]
MRSSKSRSRSKSNRPRTIGNIVNRVFDSSGPDGKVRGTPQQIIEKYLFLARDAQLSNDRVAAENFNQHAEHYTRMLAEAQRELAAEQEQRQPQQQQPQQQGNPNQNQQRDRQDRGDYRPDQQRNDQRNDRNDQRPERDDRDGDQPYLRQPEAFELIPDDSGLVETPESRHSTPRRGFEADDTGVEPAPKPRFEHRVPRPRPAAEQAAKPAADAPAKAPRPEGAAPKPRRKPKPQAEGDAPETPPRNAAAE